eukprot:2798199-Prymnesium_polylepis.1
MAIEMFGLWRRKELAAFAASFKKWLRVLLPPSACSVGIAARDVRSRGWWCAACSVQTGRAPTRKEEQPGATLLVLARH